MIFWIAPSAIDARKIRIRIVDFGHSSFEIKLIKGCKYRPKDRFEARSFKTSFLDFFGSKSHKNTGKCPLSVSIYAFQMISDRLN